MARLFEEICTKINPPNNINSLGASTYGLANKKAPTIGSRGNN
jgi:hypothetical protein